MSGSQPGLETAVSVLAVRGRLCQVGIHAAPRTLDLHRFFWRELELLGARLYQREDFARAVELVASGDVPAQRLISDVVPLERVGRGLRRAGRRWCGEGARRVPAGRRGRRRVSSPFDLTGRTAAVTGGSRGIGAAAAVALARAGADVIGVSTRGPGDDVADAVRACGRSFTALACDLADRAATVQLGADLAARGVDALVANGGTIRRTPAAQHSLADWDHVLEVDLTSQFVLAQAVGGAMVERGSGSVVFTASLLSFQGGITVPAYTAAKHGVAGITKALANEWASRGVNVNAVAPGYIATDNTQALREDADRSRAILERIPAGRWGRADDVAGAVVYLCSPAARYVHGVVLPVDGGWLGR